MYRKTTLQQLAEADQQDRLEALKNEYEKEAKKAINNLNYKAEANRHLLASNYRKLHQVLTDRLNHTFYQDPKIIDKVAHYSFCIRPYDIGNLLRQHSMINWQQRTGGRRCTLPVISVDGQRINFQGKSQKFLVKEKDFELIIDSQPNSFILYTNQPVHPLLSSQGRQSAFEKCVLKKQPPYDINVVVIKQPHKIESHMLTLRIKHNKLSSNTFMGNHSQLVTRPRESINFDQSISIINGHESFNAIENESESR